MRAFAARHGRWLTLDEKEIGNAIDWSEKHGRIAVISVCGRDSSQVHRRASDLPGAVGETVRVDLRAYDAGSEGQTEPCQHVPREVHGRRMTSGAEGTVREHQGIRGDRDVPPAGSGRGPCWAAWRFVGSSSQARGLGAATALPFLRLCPGRLSKSRAWVRSERRSARCRRSPTVAPVACLGDDPIPSGVRLG